MRQNTDTHIDPVERIRNELPNVLRSMKEGEEESERELAQAKMAATKKSQTQPNSVASHSPGFWFRDIEHALNSFSGIDKGQKVEKGLKNLKNFRKCSSGMINRS